MHQIETTDDEFESMKYVQLPDNRVRALSFYLAMEEYVARHVDESVCFFMWQVKPSVIFGRNQFFENEVNIDYCRQHNIEVFRRKSGGGCVYADQDNLMLSLITREENVGIAFNQYINMVILVLRKLGIEAVGSHHNDIMIGDRKVSGTACYKLDGHCIVHGTLLYDTNMEHMTHAITPTQEKLLKNGVQSVRQRICLLKDYISYNIEELRKFIQLQLCEGELLLTDNDISGIEELKQKYEIIR